ncbi:MAG: putative endonuclease [Alteromonadaceae bacterium]|jgi:putative endonuclease
MKLFALIKRWFNPLPIGQNSTSVGRFYEDMARQYLQKQGLRFIEANFNCRYGELDLIMADADQLVFVEVKFRTSQAYGGAIGAISHSKQRKLIKTAKLYMQQQRLSSTAARFDVVAIQSLSPSEKSLSDESSAKKSSAENSQLRWIKNAFYANAY